MMLALNVKLCLFVFSLSPFFGLFWAILVLFDSGVGQS